MATRTARPPHTRPNRPITFIVNGQDQLGSAGTRGAGAPQAPALPAMPAMPAMLGSGRLKHSVRLGTQRGGAQELRLQAVPGEDVVVLHLAQGPALVLSPENARLLLLSQSGATRPAPPATRGGGTPAPEAGNPDDDAPATLAVPMQLQWQGLEQAAQQTRGATRGRLGQVLLAGLDVVTGFAKDWLTDRATDFATSKIVAHFDGQVNAGVYALDAAALAPLKTAQPLDALPPAPDGGPLLVLVHGTFSDTPGTFGKLWGEHPARVRALFDRYAGRVYALDHPTLGASPADNALTLVRTLPRGTRLHLLTHSRGGLVAEVLARACAAGGTLGEDELALFPGGAYRAQREALQALVDEVARRDIRVDRVVRVACPARGTLLASRRLDAYLSVLKWTMELAGLAVTPALVDLLGEVARRRADPAELPGLAAMMPDSPLVQWLHAVDTPLPGELRVIAGDLQGDSVVSWLKTLLADGFYWTDNDLVVHTSSMYGGAPRAGQATFVLDQGGKVSHFNYFSNERTAALVVDGLLRDDTPQDFQPIGPLSAAGQSATGIRAARRADATPAKDRPAVFILPGILGSNLKVDGKRIWLGWRIVNGLKRLAYTGGPDGVEPDGPMGMTYDDLIEHLAATHEVIPFAYDWRRPLEQEAARLADAVEAALAARDETGQPVRLLAHSMGGLLARTLQLERPQTWDRLMGRPGARLLMLGTPNAGSWAPMQVLSGDDTFGNALVAFGAPFQDHSARMLMATFPGFIQLQTALVDDPRHLDQAGTWQKLAADDIAAIQAQAWWHSEGPQLATYRWGVPPQTVLDQAVALRRRLDAQRRDVLPRYADRMLLVVGKERFTPDGYEIGNEGLTYLDAPEDGDGRVTLDSARLPGVRTWQLDCAHGSLPDVEKAFDAYVELLTTGATAQLAALPDIVVARGGTAAAARTVTHVRSRPSRQLRLLSRPPQVDDALRGLAPAAPTPAAAATPALRVQVINSDLSFVRQPLLLGHYRSLAFTGAERVVNGLVGGTMQKSLDAGVYPEAPGTHQIFVNGRSDPLNPWRLPRPQAVVVVGLGEEGKLQPGELARSVRLGVIAWAQRMAEEGDGGPAQLELAATLIGSGGTGIGVGQAAQQVATGVRDANERLRTAGWPTVATLVLIELYLDRASEAWRALQVMAGATPGRFEVADAIAFGAGALRRPPDYGYRGADYDYVSALPERLPQGGSRVAYTLATRRARTELRAQATQSRLLSELVQSASSHDNNDHQIGRTLFQLLVPPELEAELAGAQALVMEVAPGTAAIPWELLDTRPDPQAGASEAQRPWAIRSKLVRKLRLEDFRPQPRDALTCDDVLVIGEPLCDAQRYPELIGAREEAEAVSACLGSPGHLSPDRVSLVTQADSRTVVNALLERDWRIVHIAGHGEPPTDDEPGGVVLSNGTFLGPREIGNMRVVPELVFVNCCHLAARQPGGLLKPPAPYDRAGFAANVAEALIRIGVRCVIAAGWAVEDEPAKRFATTFYSQILQRRRFIDAVAAARVAAWDEGRGGNTWAAYQCYGDPDWVFHSGNGARAGMAAAPLPLAEEFAGIASPSALTLALETLAIGSQYQGQPAARQRDRLRHLAARFGVRWGGIGAVAEAFGVAHAAAGDAAGAVEWYRRAASANDGSASLKSVEQLANLQVRLAWESVRGAVGPRGAGRGAGITRRAQAALQQIDAALEPLRQLAALQPSLERSSLCGSGYKRLAMVHGLLGQDGARRQALARMREHYAAACQAARGAAGGASGPLFYPGLNLLAAQWLDDGRLDESLVAEVTHSLGVQAGEAPDFWCIAGQAELQLLQALVAGRLAAASAPLVEAWSDLGSRVTAPSLWQSVRDQAVLLLDPAPGDAAPAAERLLALLDRLASPAGGPAP